MNASLSAAVALLDYSDAVNWTSEFIRDQEYLAVDDGIEGWAEVDIGEMVFHKHPGVIPYS